MRIFLRRRRLGRCPSAWRLEPSSRHGITFDSKSMPISITPNHAIALSAAECGALISGSGGTSDAFPFLGLSGKNQTCRDSR